MLLNRVLAKMTGVFAWLVATLFSRVVGSIPVSSLGFNRCTGIGLKNMQICRRSLPEDINNTYMYNTLNVGM